MSRVPTGEVRTAGGYHDPMAALDDGTGPGPGEIWASLDEAWQVAFAQAWEALRAGCIPVGACVTTASGELVHASRNRVMDSDGPPGEVWGTALAHAEINALARLPFRRAEDLVLTTTLEPCLQCAAAIRLGPVAAVRFAGADTYWDGCHDFTKLSEREAGRRQAQRIGPRADELGLFATVISRTGPALTERYEAWLRAAGEGPVVDLACDLMTGDRLVHLAKLEVDEAFGDLFDELQGLRRTMAAMGERSGSPAG